METAAFVCALALLLLLAICVLANIGRMRLRLSNESHIAWGGSLPVTAWRGVRATHKPQPV